VIHSVEVYSFLLETFHTNAEAWIGLKYDCATHELEWADGQKQQLNSFRAWHPRWDQSETNSGCIGNHGGEAPYMPVAVTQPPAGFKWIAKGGKKEYTLYFVEYPSGKP